MTIRACSCGGPETCAIPHDCQREPAKPDIEPLLKADLIATGLTAEQADELIALGKRVGREAAAPHLKSENRKSDV